MTTIATNCSDELLCPVCGHNATHMEIVHVSARPEDRPINEITVNGVTGQVTTHGADPAPMGTLVGEGRRHRIVLSGDCEGCRTVFSFVFTQDKGSTYVELVCDQVEMARP
jgi:hypothetical protein